MTKTKIFYRELRNKVICLLPSNRLSTKGLKEILDSVYLWAKEQHILKRVPKCVNNSLLVFIIFQEYFRIHLNNNSDLQYVFETPKKLFDYLYFNFNEIITDTDSVIIINPDLIWIRLHDYLETLIGGIFTDD